MLIVVLEVLDKEDNEIRIDGQWRAVGRQDGADTSSVVVDSAKSDETTIFAFFKLFNGVRAISNRLAGGVIKYNCRYSAQPYESRLIPWTPSTPNDEPSTSS